jgi:hypothetical protein
MTTTVNLHGNAAGRGVISLIIGHIGSRVTRVRPSDLTVFLRLHPVHGIMKMWAWKRKYCVFYAIYTYNIWTGFVHAD